MEIKVNKNIKITLELDPKEAYWLKSICQNKLCPPDIEESLSDGEIRLRFFNALPDFPVLSEYMYKHN
jgi:hypothetical protein